MILLKENINVKESHYIKKLTEKGQDSLILTVVIHLASLYTEQHSPHWGCRKLAFVGIIQVISTVFILPFNVT